MFDCIDFFAQFHIYEIVYKRKYSTEFPFTIYNGPNIETETVDNDALIAIK